jgi:hypothetical protein
MPRTNLGSYFSSDGWLPRHNLMSTSLATLPVALGLAGLMVAGPAGAQKVAGGSTGGGPTPKGTSGPVIGAPTLGHAQVLTYHNDNQRTGLNPYENVLTPAVVKAGFGKLFSHVVDGTIYGQPLFISDLTVTNVYSGTGTAHKGVVIVSTANNSIYAFDANNATGTNSGPLWYINFNFLSQNISPVPGNAIVDLFGNPQTDIQPVIGIIGTPVINPTTGTLFALVRTEEDGNYVHRLHAIDVTTGLERYNSPVNVYNMITGNEPSVLGTGDGADGNGNVILDPLFQNQRPALTLSPDGTTLYIAYDGTENIAPYHGWILSYDTTALTLKQIFNSTPNAYYSYNPGDPPVGGGFNMSGGGLALDTSGNIYAATGIGQFDANASTGYNTEYGESILHLNPTTLTVSDYFTPYNYLDFNNNGTDLGAGGVVVLPDSVGFKGHPHLLAAAGNEGTFYLLDRDNLGKIGYGADTGALYTRRNSLGQQNGTPAFFNGQLFYHAAGDVLRAFQLNPTYPYVTDLTPATSTSPVYDFPGAIPSVSANGTTGGLVWEIGPYYPVVPNPTQGFGQTQPPQAVLTAYDATAPGTPIWSSNNAGGRDTGPNYIKFSVPTVANGEVFVGGDGALTVYGAVTTPAPSTGVHYVISGPNVMFGISPSSTTLPGFLPPWTGDLISVAPELTANVKYDFSVTAIGADGNPLTSTQSIRLYLEPFGFSTIKSPLTSVQFNNKSNATFTTYFPEGLYNLVAIDNQGNSSFVPIQVGPQTTFGFDHYVVHAPQAVRDGQLTTILLTAATANGTPVALPFSDLVGVYDTLPAGTQPYDIDPANAASYGLLPTDGTGFLDEIDNPAATSTTGFSYEFQQGFGNFTQLGFPAPDPDYYLPYQTNGGDLTAGIQVRLHGVGLHVIVVTDALAGFSTNDIQYNLFAPPFIFENLTATAIINVIPSGQ